MRKAVVFVLALSSSVQAQVPNLTGTIIVTNKSTAQATFVDVATGRTLGTVPTGAGPHEIALSANGRIAVVTNYGAQQGGNSLTVIDVPGMRVTGTINLTEYRRPHGIAFLPGDTVVAVTSEASQRVVFAHVGRLEVTRTIPTQHPGSHMLAVVADASRIYTGDMGSHTVSELNVRTGEYVKSWPVPNTPEAINVTPDGREVWVGSNDQDRVSVVDVQSGQVRTAAEGLGWPYRILFTPDVRTVILPDMEGEDVRFVDRASHRELGRISFPGGGPQGITVTPDGRYAFQSLSRQSRVAVIDVAERKVVGYLQAGAAPDGVVYLGR